MEEPTGWSSDPSGRHWDQDLPGGRPTVAVGGESGEPGAAAGPFGAMGGEGSRTDSSVPATVAYLEGWHADQTGRHELRYYAKGAPTVWVSDDGQVSEDPAAPASPPIQPPERASGPGNASASDLGTSVASDQTARPAGWYRSASDPSDVRYWDGRDWTEQRVGESDGPHQASYESNGTPSPPIAPEPSAEREGWHPDPFGRHRLRWFTSGVPTNHVSDGNGRVFDESDGPVGQEPSGIERPLVVESHDTDSSPALEADWYLDPDDSTRLRYWDGSRWAHHDDESIVGSTPESASEEQDDLVSKLERLAALRNSGALTPDEFRAAKDHLLRA